MATDPKKKKEALAPTSTALELASVGQLLPEGIVFEELMENFKELDNIEFPRVRFRQGKFYFSDDPEDKGVEEFSGVLLWYGGQNTYWEGSFDKDNIVPPDCFSVDAKVGTKPRDEQGRFGNCADCALNQFKSHSNGKGKACRNQKKLYIQVLGNAIPSTLFLAPTSIGAFDKTYIINKVTQKGLVYFKVVTKFKAFQQDPRDTFWRVGFEIESVFKDEEATKVKSFRDFWMPAFARDRARLDSSVTGGGGGDDDTVHSPALASTSSKPQSQPQKKVEASGDKNLRTVKAVQPAKTVVAESSGSDDDEPPF